MGRLGSSIEHVRPRASRLGHHPAGDRIAIAAYLGRKDTFEQAVADFSNAYADRNDKDHAKQLAAIKDGRVEARTGL